MGPFCVTRSNQTHQLTDPTQPNPLQVEKFGPNPTLPTATNNGAYSLVVMYFLLLLNSDRFPVPIRSVVKLNLTAWCNKILSDLALNALTQFFQIFSTFAIVDPTQLNPAHQKNEKSRPNPTQNKTTQPMDNSGSKHLPRDATLARQDVFGTVCPSCCQFAAVGPASRRYRSRAARPALSSSGGRMRAVSRCQRT